MYCLCSGRYPEIRILRVFWATIIPVLSYTCDGNKNLCFVFVVYSRRLLLNRFLFEFTGYQENKWWYSSWKWKFSFVHFCADG